MRSAPVLGGGGLTGIAWELGILHGLADAGVDLTSADTVIGTSAGSVVGFLAVTGDVERGFAAQLEPDTDEIAARPSWIALAKLVSVHLLPGGRDQKLARLGRMAMAATPVVSAERRLEVIRSRWATGPGPTAICG
jgi:NTE family protein